MTRHLWPDSKTCREQLPEIGSKSRSSGHTAPDDQRRGHDPGTAETIREHGHGNTKPRVKQRKGQSAHQTQLAVGETEIGLDRHREDTDDLAIDKIEGINYDQDKQYVGAIGNLVVFVG